MPHPKFDAHDVSIASDALIPSSTVAFSPVADTADTAAEVQQAQAASQASYQRPALTRVGQWQSVTLVISIPIGPGSTGVIYGGNG